MNQCDQSIFVFPAPGGRSESCSFIVSVNDQRILLCMVWDVMQRISFQETLHYLMRQTWYSSFVAVHLFLHTAVQVPAIKPYFHRLPFGWLFARKAGPLKSRVLFLTTDLVQIFRYFDHPAIQGPISYWATYVLSHLSTSSLSFSNYLLHPGCSN